MGTLKRGICCDADVLIDYYNSDLDILTSVACYIGPIYIPRPVLEEVNQLDEDTCNGQSLEIIDLPDECLDEVAGKRRGLSFSDRACLTMARKSGWICLSNNIHLREECITEGVDLMWGLHPMLLLVQQKHLTAGQALLVARQIHQSNPQYITSDIIGRFAREVKRHVG